jgi:hypothetical protein
MNIDRRGFEFQTEPFQEGLMAELKGSKTEESLKAAFAGESQANRRYLYFAQKADIEAKQDMRSVIWSTWKRSATQRPESPSVIQV